MKPYLVIIALTLLPTACATLGFDTPEDYGVDVPVSSAQDAPAEPAPQDKDPKAEVAAFVLEGAEVDSVAFEFESHGETLAGELVVPRAESVPRPGVVIVHDSGPLSRDGIMNGAFGVELPVEVAVYRTLAEELAARGFIVLIWDKRTCLKGSQPWCEYPREHIEGHVDQLGEVLVDDMNAAVRALRADERTNDTVHVIAHGHGADVALSSDATISSIVLASPNTDALDAMVLTQIDRSIEALQARTSAESNAETDVMVKELEALQARRVELAKSFESIRNGDGGETAGLSAAAWRGLSALHDKASKASPQVPVLVIEAGLDLDVDAEVREEWIGRRRASGAQVVQMDDLTRPMVSVAEDEDPTTVSSQVIQKVLAFLISASDPPGDRQ
jgi:alpha-beta hydrolase superfamily lysophospholipase